MTFKKLDIQGFSHEIVLLLFVVIFGVAGAAYLVATHADALYRGCGAQTLKVGANNRCVADARTLVASMKSVPTNISAISSAPDQNPNVYTSAFSAKVKLFQQAYGLPTTGTFLEAGQEWQLLCNETTSAKSSAWIQAKQRIGCPSKHMYHLPVPPHIAATCSVSGVPSSLATGQRYTPEVAVTNTGNTTFVPTIYVDKVVTGDSIERPAPPPPTAYTLASVEPGKSTSKSLGLQTKNQNTYERYSVSSKNPSFSCTASVSPTTPTADSGISGKVYLQTSSGTQPGGGGGNNGITNSPYQATIQIKNSNGSGQTTTVTSNADGTFKTTLVPGTYTVTPQNGSRTSSTAQQITVTAGTYTNIAITYRSTSPPPA